MLLMFEKQSMCFGSWESLSEIEIFVDVAAECKTTKNLRKARECGALSRAAQIPNSASSFMHSQHVFRSHGTVLETC